MQIRHIKAIEIVAENGDCTIINRMHIGALCIDGIQRTLGRTGKNTFGEKLFCNDFRIEIHKGADHSCKGAEDEKMTVFKRFSISADICCIKVYYMAENGQDKAETIYVPWGGDSFETNKSQRTMISEAGHLYIHVSDTPNDAFFDYAKNQNVWRWGDSVNV